MKDIIEKLYNLHINTETYPLGLPDKENLDEELRVYERLCNLLGEEEKQLFSQYVEQRGIRQSEELKAVYEYGFKSGVQLIIEALKD